MVVDRVDSRLAVARKLGAAPTAARLEITVTGSMAILRSFAPAAELIGSGVIDPRPLLSEPLPLAEFGKALHRVRTGQGIKWHIRP
jgi:threonine dehydrogenase-like Zn-dependent dehydrogenase